MPHEMFRSRIITSIKTAMAEFDEAARVEHPGLKGRIREIAAKRIFEPILPEDFKIKVSGKIIDHTGFQSSEVDLVIYSKKKLPSIMYGEEDILFPAESVFYAIEVKSRLTAGEIRDAHSKAKNILNNIQYMHGFYDEDNRPIQHQITKIIPALFAFSSDLAPTGKTEIDRYKENLEENEKPTIFAICVIGRGYWDYVEKFNKWLARLPSPNFDEAIEFAAHIANSLHKADLKRGYPRIGNYLVLEGRKITAI